MASESLRERLVEYFELFSQRDVPEPVELDDGLVLTVPGPTGRRQEAYLRVACESQALALGIPSLALKTVGPLTDACAPRSELWSFAQRSLGAQGVYLHPQRLVAERSIARGWRPIATGTGVQDRHVAEVGTLVIEFDPVRTDASGSYMATEPEVWECFGWAEDAYEEIVAFLGSSHGVDFAFHGNGFGIWLRHEWVAPADVASWRKPLVVYAQHVWPGVDDVADLSRVFPLAGTLKAKLPRVGAPYRYTAYWPGGHGRIPAARMVELCDWLRSRVPAGALDEIERARDAQISAYTLSSVSSGDDPFRRARKEVDVRRVWSLLGLPRYAYCFRCNSGHRVDERDEVQFSRVLNAVKCWNSACKTNWSTLDLVMHVQGVSITKAYDWLASEFRLPPRTPLLGTDWVTLGPRDAENEGVFALPSGEKRDRFDF